MASYHISEMGPRVCRASVMACPYELRGEPHFDDIQGAQEHYDKTMTEKYGLVGKTLSTKSKNSDYFRFHNYLDKLQVQSPAVKSVRDFTAYRRNAPTSRNLRKAAIAKSKSNGAYRGTVRSKMHRQGFGGQISRMATKGGKQVFKAVGPTPRNVMKFYRALDKEVKTLIR